MTTKDYTERTFTYLNNFDKPVSRNIDIFSPISENNDFNKRELFHFLKSLDEYSKQENMKINVKNVLSFYLNNYMNVSSRSLKTWQLYK